MRRTILTSEISTTHQHLDAAIHANATRDLIDDFARKNQREARAKALVKLKSTFAAANFQWSSCDKPPMAAWSYLKIRDAKDWTGPTDHPRDSQQVVAVYYLLVGKLPNGATLSTGRWGIEYTWHCLARLVSPERSPLAASPLKSLLIAHKTLLQASADAVFQYRENFLLPVAPDGALLCQAIPAEVDGIDTTFVIARTWLVSEMATNNYARIPPATDRDDMLGSYHLMPPPLRRDLGETIQVPVAALQAFA
jgi:hypothetical protein